MSIDSNKCELELKRENIIPKKFYGQVFTTDESKIDKLISTIHNCYHPGTIVVEIGAGLGYITQPLYKKFDQLIAVEFDEALFNIMYKKFIQDDNLLYLKEKSDKLNKFFIRLDKSEKRKSKNEEIKKNNKNDHEWNIHLFKGDILDFNPPKENYLLVGNIPFHISGKLYRKFMSDIEHKPYGMVFITDNQYAKTLAGQPPRCYRISLQAQAYGDIKIIDKVPPESVYPPPKVTCCIMKIMQNDIVLPKNFWEVVNYHWEHFPTPEVESPKKMGLKRWIELCEKSAMS